jgi:hypothetical protein
VLGIALPVDLPLFRIAENPRQRRTLPTGIKRLSDRLLGAQKK